MVVISRLYEIIAILYTFEANIILVKSGDGGRGVLVIRNVCFLGGLMMVVKSNIYPPKGTAKAVSERVHLTVFPF